MLCESVVVTTGVRSMAGNRDIFFAELDALTEKEIEARLPLFDSEQLSLVQEYVDRKAIEQIKAVLQGGFDAPQASNTASAAFGAANSANRKATIALIFALGGWLAGIAAVIAYFMQG